MPRLTAHRACWLLILAIALALRLAGGVWWQARIPPGQQFHFADSASYWALGEALARGDPYQYVSPDQSVFRTPGYPLLLAGLFRLFGGEPPIMAARALSAVLGTLSVAIVGWWTTRLFDARAGCFAGAIAAIYPAGVAMGVFVLSESAFCPLMLAQLGLWGLAWQANNSRHALCLAGAGGVAAALATLMRPSWLLFTPFALLVALIIDPKRRRQVLLGGAMCAMFVVTMLPWWIRNWQVAHHFIPTTLQVGASLYDGLNPKANGASHMEFVADFTARERADATGEQQDTFEVRLDRRLMRAAIDWAKENPRRAIELAWVKLLRIWNVWPNEPAFRGWPVRLAVFCSYVPLLCLGLVGAWRFTRLGWPYVLAWLPAVYFTLLHVLFVGSIRYREPAMLALTVLAAGALAVARPARRSDTPAIADNAGS